MKRFILILLICIVSLFPLTACSVEGAEEVTGVSYVRDVVYVDLGVKTKIDYKVFPSTAKGYRINHDYVPNYKETDYYKINNGVIIVKDKAFTGVSISIEVNGHKDECFVKLREYPSSVSFDSEFVSLYGGTAMSLELNGIFKDGLRKCENSEFNYSLTSSNPSVIQVVDSDRLAIKSTGRRGESQITVSILNSEGKQVQGADGNNLTATINVVVSEYIKTVVPSVGNNIAVNDQTMQVKAQAGDFLTTDFKCFDQSNFLIDNAEYFVLLSNQNVVKIVEDENGKKLEVLGYGEVYVTLQSKGVDVNGNPIRIKFLLKVQNS